ncbi:hypothetical protein ATCC90586_002836 [Pythium insidiosum]|nr:hypothetical protein ATCC90586_002836 [Pythium insidiosum]
MGMAGDSMIFTDGVASEEQLERALDDLPFLDTENLALDPALALGRPNTAANAASQQPSTSAAHEASSSSASSGGEEDDDDDDDDTASANSASPLPSPSPTMSPVMSRSPSP